MFSAIMLTTSLRSKLRPCAIRCFLRQSQAPERELIIASEDDLPEVANDISNEPRIRFVKTPKGLSLPDKRNAAIEEARYPWITFWDDDDWSSQIRLASVAQAIRLNRDAAIIGQSWIYFHELRSERRFTYRYEYPNLGYVVGGPMAFDRSLWIANKFRAYETGGDEGWWTIDRIKSGVKVGRTDMLYVAMLHGNNAQNRDLPRVVEGRVLSDSYMKLIGGREVAHTILGSALDRFEEAVA